MKLCRLKVSVFVNLSYLFFPSHFSLLPCIFEAAFSSLFFPVDLCLSVEVIFFRYWGSSIYTSNQFFLKNLFVIRNDFF